MSAAMAPAARVEAVICSRAGTKGDRPAPARWCDAVGPARERVSR